MMMRPAAPSDRDVEATGQTPRPICLLAPLAPAARREPDRVDLDPDAGPGPDSYAAKRCLDVALSLAILAPAAAVMLVAMALVRLTSRGPALYTQTRLGLGGRPFTIYKIRTMTHDCERGTGPRWCRPGDRRVTRLGRLLRASHIDELPQLWNVLRGEMSLIGPRPERPEIAEQIERALPRFGERLRVRPGVTGLAQVQLPPDVDLAGVRSKLACDLFYIQVCGPWLDARILVATVAGVIGLPFWASRVVLQIPGGERVEHANPDLQAPDEVASWAPA